MNRSHIPLQDDRYRLPSRRVVRVIETFFRDGERVARCAYEDGREVVLTARMLVNHAWRLA